MAEAPAEEKEAAQTAVPAAATSSNAAPQQPCPRQLKPSLSDADEADVICESTKAAFESKKIYSKDPRLNRIILAKEILFVLCKGLFFSGTYRKYNFETPWQISSGSHYKDSGTKFCSQERAHSPLLVVDLCAPHEKEDGRRCHRG